MSPETRCGLIVFLRSPVEGKVKTRIASSLGEHSALEIYQQLTAITIELVSKVNCKVYLFYQGYLPEEKVNPQFHLMLQVEGDLGTKMHSALQEVLKKNDKVIIIGSDCPLLSQNEIDEAFDQLDHHDFVIGPTEDGGYYLLGCKQAPLSLFEKINWSTPEVLKETINRIDARKQSCYLLRKLYDIDTVEDWRRFINQV